VQAAGTILSDLVLSAWSVKTISQKERLQMVAKLIDIKRTDYTLRNIQSRIIARILSKEFPNVWNGLLDNLTEKL